MKEHKHVVKIDGSEPGCCSPLYATSVLKTPLTPVPALSWGESTCFWMYCCCSLFRWKLQRTSSCYTSLLSSTDVNCTIFEMTLCWQNTTMLLLLTFEPLPATGQYLLPPSASLRIAHSQLLCRPLIQQSMFELICITAGHSITR